MRRLRILIRLMDWLGYDFAVLKGAAVICDNQVLYVPVRAFVRRDAIGSPLDPIRINISGNGLLADAARRRRPMDPETGN